MQHLEKRDVSYAIPLFYNFAYIEMENRHKLTLESIRHPAPNFIVCKNLSVPGSGELPLAFFILESIRHRTHNFIVCKSTYFH
jgi:hypothetical protein